MTCRLRECLHYAEADPCPVHPPFEVPPFEVLEDPRLYEAAKRATHASGMPWTDPRTGITYGPPPAGSEVNEHLSIRVATDAEQRDAILRWAQQAHRQGSGHDCSEWLAGFRCMVCGSWVDRE